MPIVFPREFLQHSRSQKDTLYKYHQNHRILVTIQVPS